MILKRFIVGQLETNCYIVGDEEEKKVAVIDPGGDCEKILNFLRENDYKVIYIIATHGHADHIYCIKELRDKTFAKVLIHENESEALSNEVINLSAFMGEKIKPCSADAVLKDEDVISIGKYNFNIIHTPGHSKGGICIQTQGILFSGDTLFKDSVGRTDLPGGNHVELIESIKNKLFMLDDNIKVYPGHGEATTIEYEKNNNPYVN